MSDPTPRNFRCLIVEDEPDFASLVSAVVTQAGGEVTLASTLGLAREEIGRSGYDLVLLDNKLPDGTGYTFHPFLASRLPQALVIMITGAPEVRQAVALTRNGLFDYLTKPVDIEALEAAIARARVRWSQPETSPSAADQRLVGQSPAFSRFSARLQSAARHRGAIVLLLGETGTGKDMAARQLHAWTYGGEEAAAPFVPLNCSAIPAEMFEAELFGSERGAYTGADRRRGGLAEAAMGGTLFLDEVGDVPLNQQSKLLRFLESREYRALGAATTKVFDGRIVAATNRDLAEEVRRGRFRQDLLYRLDVVRLELPPLRQRREDVPLLTDYLLDQLCAKYARRRPQLRTEDALELGRHDFPGNIRELRNVLERSLLHTAEDDTYLALDRCWLPAGAEVVAEPGESDSVRSLTPVQMQEYELFKRILLEEGGAIRRTAARLGVSHQVVLRRLSWWPELRELTRASSAKP